MKSKVLKFSSISIALGVVLLALFVVTTVHASTTPATPPIDFTKVNQMQLKKMAEQGKTNHATATAARKIMLAVKAQERIINLASNVQTHLGKVIARMENIMGRLDSRIAKMKEGDTVTVLAEQKLKDARSALAAAKDALAKVGSLKDAVSSDTPREKFALVRVQFMSARDLLRQTHTLLQDTVTLLKQAPKATPPDLKKITASGTPPSKPQ